MAPDKSEAHLATGPLAVSSTASLRAGTSKSEELEVRTF